MVDLTFYESLGREERIQRIGALLCKAVTLAQLRDHHHQSETSAQLPADRRASFGDIAMPIPKGVSSEDLALLQRFDRMGGIAPREAMKVWATSRSTTHRRLVQLEDVGWLVRVGSTRAARYSFSSKARQFLARVPLPHP